MEQNKAIKYLAKCGRIITIPPFMITGLFLVLWNTKKGMFQSRSQLFLSVFFLGIMPVLAYIVQFAVPKLRKQGRKLQRNMAFGFTLAGYLTAVIYGICTNVSSELKKIYCIYFLAVIFLSVMNFVFKKKASGHACSTVAPVIILVLNSQELWALVFLMVGMLSVWSSVYLKRHLPKELVWGGCCSVMAMLVAIVII
ncbi:MAG: hypothetical protein ACI4QX_01535 [Lachnospiraceae bacterium]